MSANRRREPTKLIPREGTRRRAVYDRLIAHTRQNVELDDLVEMGAAREGILSRLRNDYGMSITTVRPGRRGGDPGLFRFERFRPGFGSDFR